MGNNELELSHSTKVLEVRMKEVTAKHKVIPFSKAAIAGNEIKYIQEALTSGKLSGDHNFTKRCHVWLEKQTGTTKAFLTPSCTHALELSALLIDIQRGDEIIMPSFTFPSTANAFVLRGAKIRFIDIRPDTMNIDERQIEKAITKKTKAVIPVHYAGIGCEMEQIMYVARKYDLFVIEDVALGFMANYKEKPLGTIGHLGALSFHETKSITCGEGGAMLINDERFIKRAEIIREKGTNRSSFFRGEIEKYSWIDLGSSYLPSELTAAFLYAQLEQAEENQKNRLSSWNIYHRNLMCLEKSGYINLPKIPNTCTNNALIFYIKVKNLEDRTRLTEFLKQRNIYALHHFVPLHSSMAGKQFGALIGKDRFTTKESEKLLRLPLYYNMSQEDVLMVVNKIKEFYGYKSVH